MVNGPYLAPTVPVGGLLELIVGGGVAATLTELVPFRAAEVVSVAVRFCVPAVSKVASKLLEVPAASTVFEGRFA